MNKKSNQRQSEIFNKFPTLKAHFEELCTKRRCEITDELIKTDEEYNSLVKNRAETSQVVLEILAEHGMSDRFEIYSDAVYAEEVYESDVIYKEAFLDAIETMDIAGLL